MRPVIPLLLLLLGAMLLQAAPSTPQRGFVADFDTIDELLATSPVQLTDTYIVKGLHAINDGLAGKFHYIPDDTSDTNSTDCFAWSTGRLKRTYDGVTASRVLVTGVSTNWAGDLSIGNYFRLLNVVPTLGSVGNAAVFDGNGTLTNGAVTPTISDGTNTLVQQLGPFTVDYYPVAIGTNKLGDGHIYKVGGTNVGTSGKFYWYGFLSGTNNSRLALYHTGTNGAAVFDSQSAGTAGRARHFQWASNSVVIARLVPTDTGASEFSVTNSVTGGHAIVSIDESGVGASFLGGSGVASFGIAGGSRGLLIASNGRIKPIGTTGTSDLGGQDAIFNDFFTERAFQYGYYNASGSEYSRLSISHSGTNGSVALDSQSTTTAGSPRPFNFNMGGTNFAVLRQVSGQPYFDIVNPITSSSGNITEASGQLALADTSSVSLNAGTHVLAVTSGGVARVSRGTSNTELDIYGYVSGGNDSLLAISHTGVGGEIRFNSRASGTGGSPVPFVFTNGPAIYNNSPGWFTGTGDPDSNSALDSAPVGSFYSRTDGGAGTAFYVKEVAGAGGWTAK